MSLLFKLIVGGAVILLVVAAISVMVALYLRDHYSQSHSSIPISSNKTTLTTTSEIFAMYPSFTEQ